MIGPIARAIALLPLLAGCAALRPVDPSPPPRDAVPKTYVSDVLGESLGAPESKTSAGPKDPARIAAARPGASPTLARGWWTSFGDAALDRAMQEAFWQNWDVRELNLRYREAQLDPAAPHDILFPLQISIPGNAQRQSLVFAPVQGQSSFSTAVYEADLGVQALYELDVFGKLDARRRAALATAAISKDSAEVNAQDTAVAVADTWFQILEARALARLQDEQVRVNEHLLEVVRARFEQRLATRLAVLQQEQQLMNAKALVPTLAAQIQLLDSKLGSVLGRPPTPVHAIVPADHALPDLPPLPDLGSPADLVKKRPDVHQEQVRVVEAEERINATLAAWLPSLNLLARGGAQTYDWGEVFPTYAAGVNIVWPLFDGGQRIVTKQQLNVIRDRRRGTLQQTLELSIKRVQDTLVQEARQLENFRQLQKQVAFARQVVDEAERLFQAGVADYLPVLVAVSDLAALQRGEIQARRLILSNRIQLHRTLGGEWSHEVIVRYLRPLHD